MSEWNSFLKQYVDAYPKSFHALSMGYANDENLGELFACADTEGPEEGNWGLFYSDPHTIEHDGKTIEMNETQQLKDVLSAVAKGKTDFPRYLYLGKQKYQVTNTDSEDVNGEQYVTVTLAGPGKGGAIVKGPNYLSIGLFEEKRDQNKGACRNDVFKVTQAAHAS